MIDLSKTGILLTAHPRQQKWWAPVLLSLELYPGPLILAYDDIDLVMIPDHVLSRFARCIATGGPYGHGRGELVCLQKGFAAATRLAVDYVLKLGFDEPVWRWRNIRQLIEIFEVEQLDCLDCNTRIILGHPYGLSKGMDLYPVEQREQGSAESHFNWVCRAMQYKRKHIADRKWWEETLGLIHLQGEYAANVGHDNTWSWKIAELWPRKKGNGK